MFVGFENGDDFARLDAVTSDLHLIVGAAEEVQVAVTASPHEIPGAVHTSSGPSRICDEALGREREASEVAASQTGSGNVQFAGNSIGDRTQPAVENMRGGVPDRFADGRGVTVERSATERVDRVFRRTVEVVAHGSLGVAQPVPHRIRNGFTAEQDQRRAVVSHTVVEKPAVDQVRRVGRCHVDDVDVQCVAVCNECLGITTQILVANVHLVAFHEPQKFLPRHVEGEGHGVRDPQAPARRGDHGFENRLAVVELHVRQAAVTGDHALGLAGRTGGVDDVRGVVESMRCPRSECSEFRRGECPRRDRQSPCCCIGFVDHDSADVRTFEPR